MTVRIRSWLTHNGGKVSDIVGKRNKRAAAGAKRSKRGVALPKFYVCSSLSDGHFERFADEIGGRRAETYLVRVLQWVALNDPLGGVIRVPAAKWGAIVLTRSWDTVSKAAGMRVHAALISSGIAVNGDTAGSPRESNGDTAGAPTVSKAKDKQKNNPNAPPPGDGAGRSEAQRAFRRLAGGGSA